MGKQFVVVALGEDVNAMAGEPDSTPGVVGMFMELTGAERVTRVRRTMDMTWQAYLHDADGKPMGYFCLYEEE